MYILIKEYINCIYISRSRAEVLTQESGAITSD